MPHTIVIKSLCGRFDIFTFVRREGIHGLDAPTSSDVAGQLKNRVASFQDSSK